MVNQPVKTPIGDGMYQGVMKAIRNGQTTYLAMVRLPINEETQKHLHDSNCITQKATASGLWLFETGELKAAK